MKHIFRLVVSALVGLVALPVAQAAPGKSWQIALDSAKDLVLHGLQASTVTHAGKPALRLVEGAGTQGETIAGVPGPMLQDGEMEADIAGRPGTGAGEGARGFVGLAFRVKSDASSFECFYIRPTNGRADDQLRRNHSTQYISVPGFPWELLRKDFPGVYESYADLVAGEWTHVRVTFNNRRAELYVNRAPQPVLIVKDLKQTPAAGGVGLWVGAGTEAFFRDLRVTASSN